MTVEADEAQLALRRSVGPLLELARQVPEIQAALRSRSAFGNEQIAQGIALAVGRDLTDPDVRIFAGVVAGARMAAQSMADTTPGLAYTDALDMVLGRLEGGIPLANEPIRGVGQRVRASSKISAIPV